MRAWLLQVSFGDQLCSVCPRPLLYTPASSLPAPVHPMPMKVMKSVTKAAPLKVQRAMAKKAAGRKPPAANSKAV